MKKSVFVLFTFLFFALFICACSKSAKSEKSAEIVSVFAIESIKSDIKWDDIMYSAIVSGVKVKSKVSGTLSEITYNEGEFIEKGAKMFVVDKQAFKAAYDRANTVLDKERKNYEKSKIKFDKAKAKYEKKSMKKKDYDIALQEHKKVEREFNEAQSILKDSEIQLKNTIVTAPVAGIAGVPIYKAGTEISPVEGTDTLTYISNMHPLKVTMFIPEDVVNNFFSGFLQGVNMNAAIDRHIIYVEAILADGSSYPEHGKIVKFDNKPGGRKGMVTVEIEFPNPDKKKIMIPGQQVKIKILKAAYKDAVVVAKSCIFRTGQETFVFIVNDDYTVSAAPVKHETFEDFVFVTSGLRGGETVVSYASGSIENGQTVKVNKNDFSLPGHYITEVVALAPIKKDGKKASAVKKGAQKSKTGSAKPKPKTSAGKKKTVSKNTAPANKKQLK